MRSLRDSGQSPEEYATKKGLVLSTLKYWMQALRSELEVRAKSAAPAFLPVSVLPAARVPSCDAVVMVEVDLANGRRLRKHVVSAARPHISQDRRNRQSTRMRRRYTSEQRARLLELVTDSDRTVPQAAAELGVTTSAAYNWVAESRKQHKPGAARSEGAPTFVRLVPNVNPLQVG